MSIASGPKVVTDGLIFSLDMDNARSWKGRPTTNIYPIDSYSVWPSVSYHYWNGNSWVINGTYTHPGVEGPLGIFIGKVCKYSSGALASTWSGNSYAYMLKNAIMTSGQSYAMSTYAYVSPNCNIDGMNSSIEGASVSAMSGYSTSYNLSQKGTWQRFGLVGVAPATSINFIPIYPYKNGVTNGDFTGFFMYGGPMVEVGTFPSPVTDTSRTDTQAIIDLTENNTITANSLTYNSDGTFEFDGVNSNVLTFPYTQSQPNNFTVSAWVYHRSHSTDGNIGDIIAMTYSGYNAWIFSLNGGSSFLQLRHHNFNTSSTSYNISYNNSLSLNTWYYVAATDDGTTVRLFVNGTSVASTPSAVSTTNGTMTCQIGAWNGAGAGTYFDGKIPMVQIHNRALSAAEVQQNFNALRGRYGI